MPQGVSDNSTCKINKNSNISINVGTVAVQYFEHKALPQISDKHIVSLSKLLIHTLSLEGDDLSFLCSQLVPADSQ